MEKLSQTSLKIALAGPLSRNDRLNNLKQGDVIRAVLVSKIDRSTALLDLYGNRVRGVFTFEVPDPGELKLEVTGNRNGILGFKMEKTWIGSGDVRNFIDSMPFLKNEMLLMILSSIKSPDFSFFRVFEYYHEKNGKFKEKKHHLRKSLKALKALNGGSILNQLVLQTAMNNAGAAEINFIWGLLAAAGQSAAEDEAVIFENSIIDDFAVSGLFPNQSETGPSYYLFENTGEDPVLMEVLHDREVFFIKTSFSALGTVEIIASGVSSPRIDVFYENRHPEKNVVDKMNSLGELISGNASVYIWEKTDFRDRFNLHLNNENRVDLKA